MNYRYLIALLLTSTSILLAREVIVRYEPLLREADDIKEQITVDDALRRGVKKPVFLQSGKYSAGGQSSGLQPRADSLQRDDSGAILSSSSVENKQANAAVFGYKPDDFSFHSPEYFLGVVGNSMTDTDGDGVTDDVDVDDDNDGITDLVECNQSGCAEPILNGGFENPVSPTPFKMFNQSVIEGWRTTATDSIIEFWRSGFEGVPAAEGNQFAELNANQPSALYQIICVQPGTIISWSVKHRGRYGTDVARVRFGASLETAPTLLTMTDGTSAWGSYGGTYTVPVGQEQTYFILEAVSSAGFITTGNFIDDFRVTIIGFAFCPDSDGDGLPDNQDTDSDNDGCSDANEAYGTTAAQGADGNMYYGEGAPPPVNANGSVIGAAYPLSNINVRTPGSPGSIVAEPTATIADEGGGTSFTVGLTPGTGSPLFQWQYRASGSSVWLPVSDGGIYAGATTATLTLSNVPVSLNGYSYRVVVNWSDYVCSTLTSAEGSLKVNVAPIALGEAINTPANQAAIGNVLVNDADLDGDPLSVNPVPVSMPTNGILTLLSNGSFTYIPNPGFAGEDSFCYEILDTRAVKDTACVSINVIPALQEGNNQPIATDDYVQGLASQPMVISVGLNDFDQDGGTLGAPVIIGGPANGTVVVNPNGTLFYTPAAGFVGADTIVYRVCDAGMPVLCDTARVIIGLNTPNLINGNLQPLAAADAAVTRMNMVLNATVASNDVDPEGGNFHLRYLHNQFLVW